MVWSCVARARFSLRGRSLAVSFLEIHTYQDVEYDTYNILEYLQLTRGGGKHSALEQYI